MGDCKPTGSELREAEYLDLKEKHELLQKMNTDNAKMRAVYLDEKMRLELQSQAQQIVINGLRGDVEKLEARWKQQMQKEAHANEIFLEYEAVVREILANELIHSDALLARARAILTPTEKCNHVEPHPPRAEGDLASPGNAAGDAASVSAPARLVPCSRCGFFHGPDCANPVRR